LHQEFYGLPAQESLLRERTVKEVLHELGHTFGLVHCSEQTCAMSLATHIELVDAKQEQYCTRCGLQLVRKFAREGAL
jgi:archaemetzincin